ncbi:MAG: hypothetical protein COW00_02580 [Bdellovibrio sp. CG12_big_fil_rev_8_21_14_0_65_39_13]|nr:MAG: hypothetical protein COW78_03535 [Bdellovibrio sp. CG22_combo_CG10-13_8_21_14_all_39_27]PIQ62024.1 MAG: hypothetical protein COW00_02580 [Bdellovibrio sp. CG12_big_fil_rev_8_21_14_0_65_39_13]PIR34108.1 MAG: hypothetical protein COV37_14265 [Bdellovibrio sp. CG11_big_fil_rev_8_21_14_0_20_39_38]
MSNSLVLAHIKQVMNSFLKDHPQLSVNALSKRSEVSEATMRRILNDQVKTEPCGDTILEILAAITKERRISELVKMFPGPISEKLSQTFGIQAQNSQYQHIPELERELNDEITYLIYKLAANTSGTSRLKVSEMLGIIGLDRLDKLISKDLIIEENGTLHARYKSFTLSNQVFARNFKTCAQFINTKKNRDISRNLFYNLSESINEDSYREVLKIQRQAMKKISQLINDPKNVGEIPFFQLIAVDHFDHISSSKDQTFH